MKEHREPYVGTFGRPVLVALTVTIVLATTLPIVAAVAALQEVRFEAESHLLTATTMVATQADRLLIEQFFELELLAATIGDHAESEVLLASLRTVYGRIVTLSSGIIWFDSRGSPMFAEPESLLDPGPNAQPITSGLAEGVRHVSMPFVSPSTGHIEVALSVPVYTNGGSRQGTLVGLLDLTEPLITDLVEPARMLGSTGHADLVDERGLVLASTNSGHVLGAGDHPDLYRSAAENRVPTVRRVSHEPSGFSLDQSQWHVMAYTPLRVAPWGLSMGASEDEVYSAVARLQRRFVAIGLASLLTMLIGAATAIGLSRQTDRA